MKNKSISFEWFKSNALSLIYAILIAVIIRTFLFQAFFIPSSSMEPTLLVGDRLFVSKFTYGYSKHSFPFSLPLISDRVLFSEPERGDTIVFKTPENLKIDYIKRLVGLPGDKIQMINGVLNINDIPIIRKKIREESKIINNSQILTASVYKETLPNGVSFETFDMGNTRADNTRVFNVPNGEYFFMGDNRDNSKDSRFIGTVPKDNLVGKAQIIFFATEGGSTILEFWKWPFDIQLNRIFKIIN
jgi:signal peptidase I|tara:strand:- start:104 stop:838 length:735 start_codon:yes stop_codon:yes gene_type:complete